ncbi:MAG: MAPEG family protein [Undibacterium sp.]|nr:MAPEG family protein [Undibacterium sp.]
MNTKYLLVLACVAMVFLSFAVAVRMFLIRVAEMKEKRLHPQAIADSNQSAAALQVVKASDNYRNLFEMPVLFYLLCGLLISLEMSQVSYVIGAWLYVLLRYGHSYVQCTYNKVLHRFRLFMASVIVLVLMWLGLTFQVFTLLFAQ